MDVTTAQIDQVYHLPERLDVMTAAQVAADLRLLRDGPVRIDAENVRFLGGLGAEILLRAAQDWATRGHPFVLSPTSTRFDAALATFGFPYNWPTPAPQAEAAL